jgi:hypothetical protein
MEQLSYVEILSLIRDNNMNQALKAVDYRLAKDCLLLIRSKTKKLDSNEVYAIFYYAFLDFCEKVKKGRFKYQNDSAFESYFKKGCVNHALQKTRELLHTELILPVEILELLENESSKVGKDIEKDFIKEKLELYGIQLDFEEDGIFSYLPQVIKSFHSLGELCKFLIILRFFVKLSHQEISNNLSVFYNIKNANVSKTQFNRCMDRIKENVLANNLF